MDTDHDKRRAALLDKVILRIAQANNTKPSMRQLANDAGVTVPTLLHYFGDRDAMISAAFAHWHQRGQAFLNHAAITNGDFEQSIKSYVQNLFDGLVHFGIGDFMAAGFAEAMLHDRTGPAFVTHALEPIIMALEQRLASHQSVGEMRVCDTRHAAIALIAPILVTCHHQFQLSGKDIRPISMPGFLEQHLDAFLRAYSA